MAASKTKRFFNLASCVAIAGATLAVSSAARADECPADDPGAITYPAPKATPACTKEELKFFEDAYFDVDTYETYKDIENAVKAKSAECAKCIFTDDDDAAWGPIVFAGPGPDDAFENFFACVEKVPGGGAACAADFFKGGECVYQRCELACTEDDYETCVELVLEDPTSCGKYDVETSCPNPAQAYAACRQDPDAFLSAVEAFCGGKAPEPPPPGSSSGGSSSSSGGSDDNDDDDDDEDDDDGSSSSSSGSSGGSKKKRGSSSGVTMTPTESPAESSSGCAQGPSSGGGSLASLLVLGIAIGATVSRRRRAG